MLDKCLGSYLVDVGRGKGREGEYVSQSVWSQGKREGGGACFPRRVLGTGVCIWAFSETNDVLLKPI